MIYVYQKKITNPLTGRKRLTTFYGVRGKTPDRKNYGKRGFISREDADTYEKNLLLSYRSNGNDNITLNELASLYFDNMYKNGKLRVVQDMQITYKHKIKPFLGDMKISSITNKDIKKWQDQLLSMTYGKNNKPYANRYLQKIQTLFSTITNYGVKYGYTNKSFIYQKAIRKNEKKREMKFYTPEEFKKFINAIDDSIVYHTLFTILYFCGLRKGEAMAVTWNDIDFKNKTMSIDKSYDTRNRIITTPKTQNSYRTLLLTDQCITALYNLQKYYKASDNDTHYVFGYYKPISVNAIANANIKYSKKAGIKRIRVHDFRHPYVKPTTKKICIFFEVFSGSCNSCP